MSKTIDFPDLDAAIDAEAWQWLQEAAPVYALSLIHISEPTRPY